MNGKYIVAGARKGAKDCSAYNLNAELLDEKTLYSQFAWIDRPDSKMRRGQNKLTLEDIMHEVKSKGSIWCENDDFFFLFKKA